MMRAVPLFLFAALLPAGAEVEREIPLGIEAVTGYRSEYIWRGFKVGDGIMDFQLQGEIALSNEWALDIGGTYATEGGDGDNTEGTFFVDLNYDTKQWSAGFSITGHAFDHPLLDSGVDFSPSFTWHATKDLDLIAGAAYDTGAEGVYGWLEGKWSKPVTDSSFVTLQGGTSFVGDYYGRDGWNDLYARASFTYALNKTISLTPFVGVSIPMDADPETNRLFGGLWFEANF
ncbi:hypothetical protein [Luteolibacter sp. LG18]|uniref:hypothetical protein n=1 Tax=Luteolibacter sp. LG18 TaxID=2819286 RepID=UPI002B2C9B8B|nr:hypothetical protein llg_24000 [Luteolibacter sp. LG18]